MSFTPEIAIVDPNILCCMGLKTLLESIIPQGVVRTFGTFSQLIDDTPEMYFHYFVASQTVLEHTSFFLERKHKTIVLTNGTSTGGAIASTFRTLNVCQSEEALVRDLLRLHQSGHAHHAHPMEGTTNHPPLPESTGQPLLSPREAEVLTLLVKGYINKEIADRLNISLTTVISHRKNIVEKLGIRSVSGLTIFAVINGYVEANQI